MLNVVRASMTAFFAFCLVLGGSDDEEAELMRILVGLEISGSDLLSATRK